MCTVYDGEPELAGLSRLRKSQIKGLLVSPGPRAPASSTGEAVNVDNPQELLKIAQQHCQAILTIIPPSYPRISRTPNCGCYRKGFSAQHRGVAMVDAASKKSLLRR